MIVCDMIMLGRRHTCMYVWSKFSLCLMDHSARHACMYSLKTTSLPSLIPHGKMPGGTHTYQVCVHRVIRDGTLLNKEEYVAAVYAYTLVKSSSLLSLIPHGGLVTTASKVFGGKRLHMHVMYTHPGSERKILHMYISICNTLPARATNFILVTKKYDVQVYHSCWPTHKKWSYVLHARAYNGYPSTTSYTCHRHTLIM